jgi:hypothetical protein
MGNLFKPSIPAPPPVAPPAPMPDPQSPAVLEAAKKAQTDALARAGRTSTILTAPANRGGDYTGRTLG